MFTGIIEELGIVKKLEQKGGFSLSVKADKASSDASVGDSVSVNGVCLTVTKRDSNILTFDVLEETLKKTNLGMLKSGDKINLERALKVNARLGGHFLTGHIDCVIKIKSKQVTGNSIKIVFDTKPEVSKYIVSKGSVAIDGISLTVGEVFTNSFTVHIIPHTLTNTTLASKREGNTVNLEADILAKYADKTLSAERRDFSPEKQNSLTQDFLSQHGFM